MSPNTIREYRDEVLRVLNYAEGFSAGHGYANPGWKNARGIVRELAELAGR